MTKKMKISKDIITIIKSRETLQNNLSSIKNQEYYDCLNFITKTSLTGFPEYYKI